MIAQELIAEHFKLKAELELIEKAHADKCRPYRDRLEQIKNLLLDQLNRQGCDSLSTADGTAYKSTITTFKVANREAFFDFCADNWDDFGCDAVQMSCQVDAGKTFMQQHGQQPPGTEVQATTRINIRRT